MLCITQFTDVLGVTVVVVALPAMQQSLHLTEAGLQWTAGIYALCFGGFLMLGGRAADLFGRRNLFMVGLALVSAASLICGLATSPAMLIVGRGAQGVGAALVMPAALSLLTAIFTEGPERRRAIAVWTATAAGGGAAGFTVGGAVVASAGWRWMFSLPVVVGIAGSVVAPRLLPAGPAPAKDQRLDLPGALALTGALLALIYGLTGMEPAGIASPAAVSALTLSVVLFTAFVLIERRTADPVVPLGIFTSKALVGASLVAFALTASTSGMGVIVTLYLQKVLSLSPRLTGMLFAPLSLAVIAGSFAGSRLMNRSGARSAIVVGLAALFGAMVFFAVGLDRSGLAGAVAALIVAGLGLGVASVASTACGISSVAADAQGTASGLLNTAPQMGTAIGIACLLALASARTGAVSGASNQTGEALLAGYGWAFAGAAVFVVAGTIGALPLIPGRRATPAGD